VLVGKPPRSAARLLAKYRRILDSIHSLGNIYNSRGRMEAYKIVALRASDLRSTVAQVKKAIIQIEHDIGRGC